MSTCPPPHSIPAQRHYIKPPCPPGDCTTHFHSSHCSIPIFPPFLFLIIFQTFTTLNKLFILSTFYRSWVIHRGIPLTFWCNGHPTTWAFSTSEFEGFQRKTKFNKFFSQLQSFNRFFGQTSAFLVAISTHFWVF